MRFHWQNLNERPVGADRRRFTDWPVNGRCWLYIGRVVLSLEWHLWSSSCSLRLSHYDHWTLATCLPPIGLYWGISAPWLPDVDRSIGLTIHDWALWWKVWTPDMEWSSGTPKWRDGGWHVIDTFLGRMEYSTRELERREVLVPMPEGNYKGEAVLEEASWTRPRWLPTRVVRCKIDLEKPIPHQGKGENSWDCGVDGTHGITVHARSIADGVGKLVGSCLHDRVRYGGWRDWAWNRSSVGS